MQQQIDLPGFLVLSRFWNFSYKHSKLAYVDGEPAGIVLGSVDRGRRDSYTYYWGILPDFRRQRLSMAMYAHYFRGLARDGIDTSVTGVAPDGPLEMYQKLGFVPGDDLVRLEYVESEPPPVPPGFHAGPIAAEEAERLSRPELPGADYWTRRPEFRQRLARAVVHVGIRGPEGIAGFATLEPHQGYTMALDYHLPEPRMAAAFTNYAFERRFPGPVVFPGAHPDTASCASLVECGYIVRGRFRTVTLDLTRPNPRLMHLYGSFPDLALGDQGHHA